jgi:hypothetical protein
MGGFVSCIKDAGFANPAFAGTLTHYATTGRVTTTDFSQGLDLQSDQLSVAIPLQRGTQGLQFTAVSLRTTSAGLVAGVPSAVRGRTEEDDAAVDYGHSFGKHWAAGVGLSPLLHTASDFSNPATGTLLEHLQSKATLGCRLGGIYNFDAGGCAGLVYDNYREDATGTGPAFGGASPSGDFTSQEAAVGISHRFGHQVLGAVEWQQLSTKGAGTTLTHAGWRVGAEVQPAPDWAVRVGDNAGAFSTGLGLQRRAWSFEYAYVKDWNHQAVEAILGDSSTNSLEVRYVW